MARRTLNSPTILLLCGAGLFLSAVLPLKWTSWLGWIRGPAMTVIAPIATPLAAIADWLRPGDRSGPGGGAGSDVMRVEIEQYKSQFLAAQQRIEQMEATITALQGGVAFGSQPPLTRLEAARIGTDPGSGTISVARGSAHGVTLNTVAVSTASPYHLVGIVTNVGPTVSAVQVITDARLSPAFLDALVFQPNVPIDQAAVAGAVRGQFRPVGNGTLAGEMGADDAARVQRDGPVYLDDSYWPSGAQRLMIGRVVTVEETDKPLFRRVVIRPEFDLTRVRSVVLRIPQEQATSGVGGAGSVITPGGGGL